VKVMGGLLKCSCDPKSTANEGPLTIRRPRSGKRLKKLGVLIRTGMVLRSVSLIPSRGAFGVAATS
jgi:hypothetical protein